MENRSAEKLPAKKRPTAKQLGWYRQDRFGLWHYDPPLGTHIQKALEDAIATRPEGAAWFWFWETFAPIQPNDTVWSLHERWVLLRHVYERDPKELMRTLRRWIRSSIVEDEASTEAETLAKAEKKEEG
jgi:hypothetical protein